MIRFGSTESTPLSDAENDLLELYTKDDHDTVKAVMYSSPEVARSPFVHRTLVKVCRVCSRVSWNTLDFTLKLN